MKCDRIQLRKPGGEGFTLVELLVVIGIIALLISILLPALSKAQQQAQLTVCMSNMRSLGQAVAIYQSENHGAFPVMGSDYIANHVDAPSVWSTMTIPVSSPVRYCPTVAQLLPLQDLSPLNNNSPAQPSYTTRSHVSYLYNVLLGGFDTRNGPWHPTGDFVTTPLIPCTYRSIPAASDTLLFQEYPFLTVVDVAFEAAGMDRGTVVTGCQCDVPLMQTSLGQTHQTFYAVSPVHFRKPVLRGPGNLTITSAATGAISRSMQGQINVCYADYSVRSVLVKQGAQGLVNSGFVKKGDVPWVLDMSTQNGSWLTGSPGFIPNTRYNPFQPW